MRNSKHGIFSLVAGLALSVGVMQAQLMLERPTPDPKPQQSADQSPCIIGDNSCSNPVGFDFTLVPDTTQDATNTNNSWDLKSPVYSVALVRTIATTNAFAVGIDVNAAGSIADPGNICSPDPMAAESLVLFQVILDPNGSSSILTEFIGGDPGTDPTRLCNGNPGGGFADNRLLPVILTGLDDADEIQFRAILRNGGGGKDSFFIIQQALDIATLRVVKQVSPVGDNFDLAIDGPDANDASGINVGNGGTIEVVDGAIGFYSFGESDATDGSGDIVKCCGWAGSGGGFLKHHSILEFLSFQDVNHYFRAVQASPMTLGLTGQHEHHRQRRFPTAASLRPPLP